MGGRQQNVPPLPEQSGVELNMPPMNGAEWRPCSRKALRRVSVVQRFPTTHNVTYAYVVAGKSAME
ncbi:hypothetical protein ACNKHU_20100 [Shigella flexneri]